jgi:hypothetical protein
VAHAATENRLQRVLNRHRRRELQRPGLAPGRRLARDQAVAAGGLVEHSQPQGDERPHRLGKLEQGARFALLELELDLADRRLRAIGADRAAVTRDLDLRRLAVGVRPFDDHRLAAEAGLEGRAQLVGQHEPGQVQGRRVVERRQLRRRVRQIHLPFRA